MLTQPIFTIPVYHQHHQTVTSDECAFRDQALMLLANVSATERGARRMMQVVCVGGRARVCGLVGCCWPFLVCLFWG